MQNAIRNKFIILLIACTIHTASYAAEILAIDDWRDKEQEASPEIIKFEQTYRARAKSGLIESNSNKKKIAILYQGFQDYPQSIFIFKYGNLNIVGKKYQSDLCFTNKLPGVFCSKITAPMILGIVQREQITQDGILVFYDPFTNAMKNLVFDYLISDRGIDIYYPYAQLLSEKKLEKTSPSDGWKFEGDRGEALGTGEAELRKYTIHFLRTVPTKNKIVFDPACSTGEFLANIKVHFPSVKTIGQELSPTMVKEAKKRVDVVYLGDSIISPVKNESVDFIFFRFLNGEVVTTEQAYNLLNALVKKCKIGGYIVVFGHSPVLVASEVMTDIGLTKIQYNGVSEDKSSVFQYYIYRKDKKTENIDFKTLKSNDWVKKNYK